MNTITFTGGGFLADWFILFLIFGTTALTLGFFAFCSFEGKEGESALKAWLSRLVTLLPAVLLVPLAVIGFFQIVASQESFAKAVDGTYGIELAENSRQDFFNQNRTGGIAVETPITLYFQHEGKDTKADVVVLKDGDQYRLSVDSGVTALTPLEDALEAPTEGTAKLTPLTQ